MAKTIVRRGIFGKDIKERQGHMLVGRTPLRSARAQEKGWKGRDCRVGKEGTRQEGLRNEKWSPFQEREAFIAFSRLKVERKKASFSVCEFHEKREQRIAARPGRKETTKKIFHRCTMATSQRRKCEGRD